MPNISVVVDEVEYCGKFEVSKGSLYVTSPYGSDCTQASNGDNTFLATQILDELVEKHLRGTPRWR